MSEASSKAATGQPLAKLSRSEWALLLVLVAIHFTHMVDFVIIMPLGERFMKELGMSTEQFGQVVAVYAIAAGVSSLLASLAMDRFDRKSVLLAMYAGFGCSTLFCGLAWNYESLLLARTLAGIFGGLAAAAIMAVIGDVFPPEKRGRAMGAISSAFAVASIVGLPLGLMLTDWYGRGSSFFVLAGLSVVVWLLGFFRLPPVRGHLDLPHTSLAELMRVFRRPAHLGAYSFTFFLVLGTFTVASFSAPYLTTLNGWTEKDLAPLYLVAGISTFLAMNAIGSMSDRLPRLRLFRIFGTASIVMGLIVTNLPPSPLWLATVVMSLFMVTASGRFIPAQAMLMGVPESRVRGSFMVLNTAVQHLASGLAPVIASLFIWRAEDGHMVGYPLVGLIASAAAAVALVLGGLLHPTPKHTLPLPEAKPLQAEDAVVEAAVS